jgi:hypothetical protein
MIRGVLEFSFLDVKIITFELEKINFVVYLIVLSLAWLRFRLKCHGAFVI